MHSLLVYLKAHACKANLLESRKTLLIMRSVISLHLAEPKLEECVYQCHSLRSSSTREAYASRPAGVVTSRGVRNRALPSLLGRLIACAN